METIDDAFISLNKVNVIGSSFALTQESANGSGGLFESSTIFLWKIELAIELNCSCLLL